MRILIDTNVLVSAFTAHGVCSELLEHCARQHTLVISEYILEELKEVLQSPKFELSHQEAMQVAHLMRTRARIVFPKEVSSHACSDSDDLPILGSAIVDGCQCLITGDKGLLKIKQYQNIDIISPSNFWRYETK